MIRGAINAVPHGEIEAARAYGMGPLLALRRVTLPAMLPHALPGLANLWLIATKDTALLAVVGFAELTLETRQAAGATRHYLLFYCAAGALYRKLSDEDFARLDAFQGALEGLTFRELGRVVPPGGDAAGAEEAWIYLPTERLAGRTLG